MLAPEVIHGKNSTTASFLKGRHQDVFMPPQTWKDLTFPELAVVRNWTIDQPIAPVKGKTVFLNRPVQINASPAETGGTRFGVKGNFTPALPGNMICGRNNFSIGGVGVAEHPLAITAATGITLDWDLTRGGFPNFNEGLRTVLDRIKPHIVDNGPANLVTVKEPIAIVFSNGSYMIVEPDNGERKFIIDHQFIHDRNVLGRQRIVLTLGSQLFAYLADARSPSYGWKTALAKLALPILRRLGTPRIPFTSIGWKNIAYADSNRILNPQTKFDDPDGLNRECIVHEAALDKSCVFGALPFPDRFVGKVTTNKTGHPQDVAAMNIVMHHLVKA